jgi:hypothetical protein
MTEISVSVECQYSDRLTEYTVEDGIWFSQFIYDIQYDGCAWKGDPSNTQEISIDGNVRLFSDIEKSTLLELEITDGTEIVLKIDIVIDPGPNPKGLIRRKRKRLKRTKRRRIKLFDLERLNDMTEFELLRLAILNSIKVIGFNRGKISDALISLKKKKKRVKFNIPRKYRTRKVDSYIGEIPYRNLLLWCTSASNSKEAALCLSINAPGCDDDEPRFPILHLVNKKCKNESCNGILKPWNFIERNSN